MAFVVILGLAGAWGIWSLLKNGATPPPVVTTIEDATKARWKGEAAVFRSMASQVRAKTLPSDGPSLAKAFAEMQNDVNSRLESAVQGGDVASNLEKIAAVEEAILKGVK
jgi:hypothetical protein